RPRLPDATNDFLGVATLISASGLLAHEMSNREDKHPGDERHADEKNWPFTGQGDSTLNRLLRVRGPHRLSIASTDPSTDVIQAAQKLGVLRLYFVAEKLKDAADFTRLKNRHCHGTVQAGSDCGQCAWQLLNEDVGDPDGVTAGQDPAGKVDIP